MTWFPFRRFAYLLALTFSIVPLDGALTEKNVTVVVNATPASPVFSSEVRIRSESGVQRLEIRITNSGASDATLQSWTVEFPWVELNASSDLISTGGWDMGRTEARIWSPAEAAKVATGSYLLARQGSSFAMVGFTTWRTFMAKLRFDAGRVVVTGEGENRVVKAGQSLALETLWLAPGADWQDMLFAYGEEIARENHIKLNAPKPYIGWATWDYFGRNWTYDQVIANLGKLLEIYPEADFLQIDGGWWPQRGDYTLVRESLQPDGMKRLAEAIHARNLVAGIHLDGMRGDAKAQVVKEHPEYFLHDANGKVLVAETINVGENLDYTYFDFSNPGARAYMRDVMRNIRRNWGFDYFKVDFLRFGLNEFILGAVKQKTEIVPSSSLLTSVERFHLGMAAMREGMGKDAYFLGCSSVFGPTFGHVDGLRSGADINPQFKQFKKCAVDNSGNFYLHNTVVHTDADYIVVRAAEDQDSTRVKAKNKDGANMTLNEAEMWTHYVALCGGPRLSSDNLVLLREERRALFRFAAAFPTADRYVPLDFWSHARDDEDVSSVILTVAKGDVYLGAFNWTDKPQDIVISGLSDAQRVGVSLVGGTIAATTENGRMVVRLPARHSSLYKLVGGNFDQLRRTLKVE